MMSSNPSMLVFGDGSDSSRAAAQWARQFARTRGSKFFLETPPEASIPFVLDIAGKQEVDYLVCGLRSRDVGLLSVPDVDVDLAVLLRRAPCPVWMVQPWAADRDTDFATAVVGVDSSPEANAAAHAAAGLLSRNRATHRLCLVHGLEIHPEELAAQKTWSDVVASMTLEQHPWLERLASELSNPRLVVDVIVAPIHAPELIGGVVRRCSADFVALGSGWLSEAAEVRASRLLRQVVRTTPCPILSV